MACLLAFACFLSLGMGILGPAYAEDPVPGLSWEGTGMTASSVPYTPVDEPVDLNADCELTLYPCGADASFKTDIESAVMILDLYQIAVAKPVSGADSYDYTLAEAYSSLSELLKEARTMEHRDKWNVFAQQAAAIIKGSSGSGTAIEPFLTATKASGADSAVIAGTADRPFRAGLYLLVPHTDVSDYWREEQHGGESLLLSETYSDLYRYLYEPQLVSMPFKRESIPTDTPVTTLETGGWYYGLKAYMKPQQEAYADLWIEKTLSDYHGNSNAVFVFRVDAVLDGKNVYSKAFSVLFSRDVVSGVRYTVAKNVPIGATVTVEETYQGSSCTPVGQTVYTGVMTENGLKVGETLFQPIPFVNEGSGSNGGGGIENTYTYQESQAGGSSGSWSGSQNMAPGWSSMPDDSVQNGTGS